MSDSREYINALESLEEIRSHYLAPNHMAQSEWEIVYRFLLKYKERFEEKHFEDDPDMDIEGPEIQWVNKVEPVDNIFVRWFKRVFK